MLVEGALCIASSVLANSIRVVQVVQARVSTRSSALHNAWTTAFDRRASPIPSVRIVDSVDICGGSHAGVFRRQSGRKEAPRNKRSSVLEHGIRTTLWRQVRPTRMLALLTPFDTPPHAEQKSNRRAHGFLCLDTPTNKRALPPPYTLSRSPPQVPTPQVPISSLA